MPTKTVTIEFEDENEALEFMKRIKGGNLRCKECGYKYPLKCGNVECD